MQNEALATPIPMLDETHSRRVYYSSMLSAISALVAFQFELYNFTLLAVLVLVNSINYWRHPIPGWRRNLDMLCAFGACWYQMFASFDLHNQLFFMVYWITIAIAVFCYQMARRHGRIYQNFDMASRWHIGLHVFANISNIMLYYGFSLQ
jgi:hypothetical protein